MRSPVVTKRFDTRSMAHQQLDLPSEELHARLGAALPSRECIDIL